MSFAHGPSARDREVLEAASDALAPAGERERAGSDGLEQWTQTHHDNCKK